MQNECVRLFPTTVTDLSYYIHIFMKQSCVYWLIYSNFDATDMCLLVAIVTLLCYCHLSRDDCTSVLIYLPESYLCQLLSAHFCAREMCLSVIICIILQ